MQYPFPGQSVPMLASAWFTADQLVAPAHAAIAVRIPDSRVRLQVRQGCARLA